MLQLTLQVKHRNSVDAALQVVNTLGIMRRLAKATGATCTAKWVQVSLQGESMTPMKFSGENGGSLGFHGGVRGVNSCCIHGNGFHITGGTESISKAAFG